ncbi:hypothetical protein [Chondromyces crocatus]|uniref:Uncharacterized protein n=1 Tax=Chondromyces crocatus TaxID=52 RepID=A0A0K1EJ53_CHOCO|nr:hypothetical protein [Chondromyces crocatus]AKT40603.1 uncharacterized protein CMC5_047590 [Chondromyces crocatus]
MKPAAAVQEADVTTDKRVTRLQPVPKVQRPTLTTALIHEIGETDVVLQLGSSLATATLDPAVHPAVIAGAHARRERVLVEDGGEGAIVVLGALRTQPTPGVEVADTYTIKARHISLEASEELSLKAQTAAVVVRAIGEVETYAERILSRAEGVHKIIGRMLRLN